jgi:hypothetical protein
MHIPRTWARAETEVESPEHGTTPLMAWGWGDDQAGALREAESRLGRLAERVRRGEPFPQRGYEYGNRPIREEILDAIGPPDDPRAVLTRNRYGAIVMNASRLLFLDVDLDEEGDRPALLGKLFGLKSAETKALEKLRNALAAAGKGTFRIYRTAGGFRALAPGREFDPAGRDAQDLMKATGTDPWFVRLCLAQKSFRARLTPKPWRMGLKAPPGEHPRGADVQARFRTWLAEYDEASKGHATCRFLETVGKGGFVGSDDGGLVELHDRTTRAAESLPLA